QVLVPVVVGGVDRRRLHRQLDAARRRVQPVVLDHAVEVPEAPRDVGDEVPDAEVHPAVVSVHPIDRRLGGGQGRQQEQREGVEGLHETNGFSFSGSTPSSPKARRRTDGSIFPRRTSWWRAASTTHSASTSKKRRSASRVSLRPKPSVPSE